MIIPMMKKAGGIVEVGQNVFRILLLFKKVKLDSYKEKRSKGETLFGEQKRSLADYANVQQSVQILGDLLKDLKTMADEVSIASKKSDSIQSQTAITTFLQTQQPLLHILTSLNSPPVRSSILKATSNSQLRLLDRIRELTDSPIPDDWPSFDKSNPNHTSEFLATKSSIQNCSKYMFALVSGSSEPVPLGENFQGCLKKNFSFRDARNLCFKLLSTITVRRAICGQSTANDENITKDNNVQPAEESEPSCSPDTTQPDIKTKVVPQYMETAPSQTKSDEMPTKPHLMEFNFLQASIVTNATNNEISSQKLSYGTCSPDQLPMKQINNGHSSMPHSSGHNDSLPNHSKGSDPIDTSHPTSYAELASKPPNKQSLHTKIKPNDSSNHESTYLIDDVSSNKHNYTENNNIAPSRGPMRGSRGRPGGYHRGGYPGNYENRGRGGFGGPRGPFNGFRRGSGNPRGGGNRFGHNDATAINGVNTVRNPSVVQHS